MKTLKKETIKGIIFTMKESEEGYTVTLSDGKTSLDTDFPNAWEDNKEKAENFYSSNAQLMVNYH